MKINRIITALLALVMMISIVPVLTVNTEAASGDDWTPPLSIVNNMTAADKKANRLPLSAFDEEKCLVNWNAQGQRLLYKEDANGGYLEASGITVNYTGFKYSPVFEVTPGIYKFTGYLRTANKGEIGCQRIQFVQFNPNDATKTENAGVARVYIGNDWTYVEFYVTLTGALSHILVNGGGAQWYIQDYCMDQFTLSKVDEIPAGANKEFGTPNTHEEARDSMQANWYIKPYDPVEEAKWDVSGGIIINRDDCLHMSATKITYNDIVRYAKQFEGTHVTDFFININSDKTSMISPSNTDSLELYHRLKENGQFDTLCTNNKNLLNGAHHIYEELKTDDYGVLIETFREIGINPWISIRMNDVHDKVASYNGTYEDDPSGRNPILSDFFYNNPQFYRVRHHKNSYSTYFDCAYDWTFTEVQNFYLGLINDALNRYDMYGLELDWQRECRLFGIGGEYNGLDILNQFMRNLDDLVAIYEEKYGHQIKIAARVPSDPMTCYDFGLDPMTWIAERTIDMIIPASRYENNDGDIPVKLWCSMADPHGVEVAMCIEPNANKAYAAGPSVSFNMETLAGLASKAYSQGADYIYFYNNFPSYTTPNMLDLTPEEKIVTDEPIYGTSAFDPIGYWNMLTSLGSPDKLLTFNRRYIISYNDTVQIWWNNAYNSQVPRTVRADGVTSVFRIPVGDVAEGSRMFVTFSTDYPEIADLTNVKQPPIVWVNSTACEFVKIDYPDYGWTANKCLTYEIPAEAHNGGYAVIEISATDQRYPFTIDFMEIYVQAHD